MEKEYYRSVHGIKLFERKCICCTNRFWVPKSSPQKHCSSYCKYYEVRHEENSYEILARKRGKRKLTYKLQKDDYED